MATPNLDYLHLRLSNLINDPVTWTVGTAAGTAGAGNILSLSQRTDYINRAKLAYIQEICNTLKDDPITLRRVLQSVVRTQAINLSLTGSSLYLDYIDVPLGMVLTGDTRVYVYHPVKEHLDNAQDFGLDDAYTILGNVLYLYRDGTILTSGAGTFYYIGGDHCASSLLGTPISQGGATDITLSQAYWDEVVKRAADLVNRELGDIESVSK